MKSIFKYFPLWVSVLILGSCANSSNNSRGSDSDEVVYEYEETVTYETRNTAWEDYGDVQALIFLPFDYCACIGDLSKYYSISERFFELEEEGGHYLKPYTEVIDLEYRYIDGERQYRYRYGSRTVYFSINPHMSMEYVVDNNNRPSFKNKDVSKYTHVAQDGDDLYFIKMN